MSDLIDRQAAIDALKGLEFCHYMEFGEYIGEDTREVRLIRAEKAKDALQNLPSAQPVRKTGQWIKRKKGAIGYNCSCCGKSDISNHFDYCPNCGAEMRGEEDEQSENNT